MLRIVRVAIPVPLPKLFDYLAGPGELPAPGCRVLVSFARREVVGVVLAHATSSEVATTRLKPLLRVLDARPWLSGELLDTLAWAARYYQHPIGEVLETALPVVLRGSRALPEDGEPALALTPAGHAALQDPARRRGTRIEALLEMLGSAAMGTARLDELLPGWRTSARSLRTRGWLEPCHLPSSSTALAAIPPPQLNAEQLAAVQAINAGHARFAPFLLEGVTGSGKTEVYLAAIAATVAEGRQALVLVPEIALTPQTTRRFRERLGMHIAILHSGLGERERARAWLAAASGSAKVILGTRSAAFVPLPAAGLIIVDEEHDASYKQQDGLRYHARDLAVLRARALAVPLVLGSATPSLESLANVAAGRYQCLPLRQRAGVAKPPSLRIMDMRSKRLLHGLALETVQAMEACLAADGQVLVFRNRRGYAPLLMCHDCGWSAQCLRCDRPLTWHRGADRLRCHHCDAEQRVPRACPQCAGTALAPQGQGTERLQETLAERFPDTPIVRVDRDTTRSRAGRDAMFLDLAKPGARILIGTQMLAKGHDLPALTLVVVVGVDEGLYSVDFRAPERLGQLIVQVAGRAGRADKAGAVILQTYHPEHPLLEVLLRGGYRALADTLLAERRLSQLPPFSQLALLRAEAHDLADVQVFLRAAATLVGDAGSNVSVHGPVPAPMPRKAGVHRAQVLLEAAERSSLQKLLPGWLQQLRSLPEARKVRWSIDVDPMEMG